MRSKKAIESLENQKIKLFDVNFNAEHWRIETLNYIELIFGFKSIQYKQVKKLKLSDTNLSFNNGNRMEIVFDGGHRVKDDLDIASDYLDSIITLIKTVGIPKKKGNFIQNMVENISKREIIIAAIITGICTIIGAFISSSPFKDFFPYHKKETIPIGKNKKKLDTTFILKKKVDTVFLTKKTSLITKTKKKEQPSITNTTIQGDQNNNNVHVNNGVIGNNNQININAEYQRHLNTTEETRLTNTIRYYFKERGKKVDYPIRIQALMGNDEARRYASEIQIFLSNQKYSVEKDLGSYLPAGSSKGITINFSKADSFFVIYVGNK